MRQSFFNVQYSPVQFVGGSIASTPATGVPFDSTNFIIISPPAGIMAGDLMIVAMALGETTPTVTSVPDGWIALYQQNANSPSHAIYYKYATANEPSSYKWITNNTIASMGASMAAFRNAIIGACQFNYEPIDPPGNAPSRTTPDFPGSAIVIASIHNDGQLPGTADAPLTLAAAHVGLATSPVSTSIAYQLNLPPNTLISGRHMRDTVSNQVDSKQWSIVLRPANGPQPVPAQVVGSAKATTPATGAAADASTNIIIPVPNGVANGDTLLALISCASAVTPPSGWTLIQTSTNNILIYRKIASGEPSSHTWTTTAGVRRTGAMIAIRGGQMFDNLGVLNSIGETIVVGTDILNRPGSNPTAAPSISTRAVDGELWVGFVTRVESVSNAEDWFVSAGEHVIQVQHASILNSCAISVLSGTPKHTTFSTQSWSDDGTAGNRRVAVILFQPI